MDYNQWKNIKRSGGFRRKVNKMYSRLKLSTPAAAHSTGEEGSKNIRKGPVDNIQAVNDIIICKPCTSQHFFHNTGEEGLKNIREGPVENNHFGHDICEPSTISPSENSPTDDSDLDSNNSGRPYSETTSEFENNEHLNEEFLCNFKEWALQFNISHDAVRKLSTILNKRIPHILPKDPRTILKTNTLKIDLIAVNSGLYWHNGLTEPLKKCLEIIDCNSDILHLLINIDGLPVYNSTKLQFWPILCKIQEIPKLSPLVVGIYAGQEKPSDLDKYLESFVREMKYFENGMRITEEVGTENMVRIKIKAFVCDSPARALIKGVSNFNSKHGCLKCTTVGEYSHYSHTVVFPKKKYPARNNEDFRAKKYGEHHKRDSPLLELNIDMVEDFPVSDSLHLIDLGVMKRLLVGWKDGKFGKYVTKWRAQDIDKVGQFLLTCKTPKEIHRSTRSIEVLAFWKASEFRTFLYYLSFVILKDVLCYEAYEHFLCFFCAITICSSEKYFHFLHLAEKLLDSFVENFEKFYSKHYITSNIHNLTHVVSEVKRFGKLQDYNAYPFENKLFSIKKLIRQGNNPLAQVARRLSEKHALELENLDENLEMISYPQVKKCKSDKLNLQFRDFVLSSYGPDKWFLNSENHVIEIEAISSTNTGYIQIQGNQILSLTNVFDTPIESSFLNVFKCCMNNINKKAVICEVSDIKCKIFAVTYDSYIYFSPLLHTL